MAGLSIFDPIYLGIDENGRPVYLNLVGRNVLVGGEPGSGKSVLVQNVLGHAALSVGRPAGAAGRQGSRTRHVGAGRGRVRRTRPGPRDQRAALAAGRDRQEDRGPQATEAAEDHP